MVKKIKPHFVKDLPDVDQNDDELDKLFSSQGNHLAKGEVVKGIVIGKDKINFTIDIGSKNEGLVPISEFELDRTKPLPTIGGEVDVVIVELENKFNKLLLSREKAIRKEAWGPVEDAFNKGELVKGVIFAKIKGGLVVDLSGAVGFLPGSQVDSKTIDIESLFNTVQDFHVLKMDKKLGNIVVSRKKVIEDTKLESKKQLIEKLSVGAKLQGVVKNITDYGAFVDLGYIDALVHITDISWKRLSHPSELLEINQHVNVIVTKVDKETGKVSLGIKHLDLTPWNKVSEEFVIGKEIKTKITGIVAYGIFVELNHDIEGLIHVSQLGSIGRSKLVNNNYRFGDEIECRVLSIDNEKYRISLAVKQNQEKSLSLFMKDNPVGTIIESSIASIVNFGLFIKLNDNLNGLLHESDISWHDANRKSVLSSYSKEDVVKCKIISFDEERERVALGIKHLTDDPYLNLDKKYSVGQKLSCKVISRAYDNYYVVKLIKDGLYFLVYKFELASSDSVKVEIPLELELFIKDIDPKNRKMRLVSKI